MEQYGYEDKDIQDEKEDSVTTSDFFCIACGLAYFLLVGLVVCIVYFLKP